MESGARSLLDWSILERWRLCIRHEARTGGLFPLEGQGKMSRPRTAKRSRRTKHSKTDWKRVDALTDEEIEAAIKGDPDTAPILDAEWFKRARIILPEPKAPISIRLDRDVLDWFKAQGPRYQSRMNAVLRAFMDAQS